MKKLLLALALMLVLVGCGDKKDSSAENQTTSNQVSDKNSSGYKEITVQVEDSEFTLPIRISDFKNLGWEMKEVNHKYKSKNVSIANAIKNGKEIELQIYSFAPNEISYDDAYIVGVTVDFNKVDTDATFMGTLKKDSSLTDVESVFGKLESYSNSNGKAVNIAPGPKQNGTIEFNSDGKATKIALRSRVLSTSQIERLASEHSQIIIEGKNSKPTSLGSIEEGQRMTLEGTIFTVPMSMKELLNDGWKSDRYKESDLVAGNTSLIELKKNDATINVFASDKGNENVKLKDLVIYQVIIETKDNAKVELLGNITFESSIDDIRNIFGNKEETKGFNGVRLLEYAVGNLSGFEVNGYVFVLSDDDKISEIRLYGDAAFYFEN